MEIKILGGNCTNCRALEKAAREAVSQSGVKASVVKVQDMNEIVKYGIMRTPALVVDEKVLSYGRVLSVSEIRELTGI